MARHGGPARKPGPRKRNGRLRWQDPTDHGHEMVLGHRLALVGGADCREARAGYPLGVLALRGLLCDPGVDYRTAEDQTTARLAAGLWFAADHAMAYGLGQPSSHLGDLVALRGGTGLDPDAGFRAMLRYAHKVGKILNLPPSQPSGLVLIGRIVLDESFAICWRELPILRSALDALIERGGRDASRVA